MSAGREVFMTAVPGQVYLFASNHPPGCKGKRYRFHREVMDVPSYQQKMLMEALEGKDKGLWFTCTPANFASRYVPEEEVEEVLPPPEPIPEKKGGRKSTEGDLLREAE